MSHQRRLILGIVTLAIALVPPPVLAQATIHTSAASFFASTLPGSYTESFDGLAVGLYAAPLNFSGGGFAYTVTAGGPSPRPVRIFNNFGYSGDRNDNALSSTFAGQAIRIDFLRPVSALGGNFFTTFLEGPGTSIAFSLSDGTFAQLSGRWNVFTGFTTTSSFITSLTLTTTTDPMFSTAVQINNLTVGLSQPAVGVVPEPVTWMLLAVGILLLGMFSHARARRLLI